MAKMPTLRTILNNTPADATDVAWNYNTIQTFVNTKLLNADGSVAMEPGAHLTLAQDPVGDLQAVTKQYVDASGVVGAITEYAGLTAPLGWALCDGAILSQASYPALFAVIGTRFNTGGEGGTQFRLPDFTDRVSLGAGANAVGDRGGSADAAVALHSHGEHSHTSSGHTHAGGEHIHSAGTLRVDVNHDHPEFDTGVDGGHDHTGRFKTNGSGAGDSHYARPDSSSFPASETLQLTPTGQGEHLHKVNVPALGELLKTLTGSTGSASGNTGSASPTTDLGTVPDAGVDPTGLNLPPFLTINKIIKVN